MASVLPVKGGWRVSVAKLGQRASKTFPADAKREAKQWGITKEAEIIAGAARARVKTGHTVEAVIAEFQRVTLPGRGSVAWEETRIAFLQGSLSFVGLQARKVAAEDVMEWVVERANVVQSSTINRDLNLLSAIFAAAVAWGWVDHNVIHDVPRPDNPEPRNRRINEEEIAALLAALEYEVGVVAVSRVERIAVAFLLALETGMRKGELLKATWAHVHVDHIHLPAAITKNRYKRDVPFSPMAKRLMALLPRTEDRVFSGLGATEFDTLWRRARDRAGVVDLHFHDTRHEAVTRLARLLDILDLAKMIGHRDLKSLMVYYNPKPQEIAARLALAMPQAALP